MIRLIVCSLLLCGMVRAMDEDPLTRPLPKPSKVQLTPLQRTGMTVLGGLPPAPKTQKPGRKVAFNMAGLAQKLSERELVSPDVTAVYDREKSGGGFLETGSELIDSAVKYGQIRRLRAAKSGTKLQILDPRMDAISSPRAFSGVIFSPKPKDRSTLRTEKTSVGKSYRPRVLSNLSSESAFGDDGQLPVGELLRTVDMPNDLDTDE